MNLQTSTLRGPPDVWTRGDTQSAVQGGKKKILVLVSGALAGVSTSSAEPTRVLNRAYEIVSYTTAGPLWAPALGHQQEPRHESTRRAIHELRRLSGLTWEQLADLFSVSRRSVHFWASGRALSADNEERLLRVLDVVRQAYRGDSRTTRTALLEATDSETAFDLLAAGRYAQALAKLGSGADVLPRERTPLSKAAQRARLPEHPERLVGARHGSVHKELAGVRGARTGRTKRRER